MDPAFRAAAQPLTVRTLAIFHLGSVGGPSRSIEGVAAWLADRGDFTAMFPFDGSAARGYRELGDVAIVPYTALTYARTPRALGRLATEFLRDVRTFRRELRQSRPDVAIVITTVLPAALVAARLERTPAITYAAEIYGQDWKGSPLLRIWGWLLARATAALSAGIVCCSRAVADQFPRRRGTPVRIAYPPIGERYSHGDRARGRAAHGLDGADPAVAVVGNISRGRAQDTAVRALGQVRTRAPRARLLLLGEPHPRQVDLDYAAELQALATELGLDDVVVASSDGDVADTYAAADVVVNPARFAEPFGRIVPEALVAGRPVVATDVGAVREVIRDGVDGLIVPPDDPDALAAAILRLWRDRELARRTVASGREQVAERFGAEQDLAAWRAVVEEAAPRTRRGR